MNRFALALALSLLTAPVFANEIWILQAGPRLVTEIPTNPVQIVDAWTGLYGLDGGSDEIEIFVTSSPNFWALRDGSARGLSPGPWTVQGFFPENWSSEKTRAWLDRWSASFGQLATLPHPGVTVVFPGVLR